MLVESPPAGVDEHSSPGYRTQFVTDSASVRTRIRNSHDWTSKYWPAAMGARK